MYHATANTANTNRMKAEVNRYNLIEIRVGASLHFDSFRTFLFIKQIEKLARP